MLRARQDSVAVAVVVALGLSACSDDKSFETPARSAQAPAPVAAPLPPPPTEAERMAQEIVNIGGMESNHAVKLILAGDRFAPGQARFEPGDKIDAVAAVLKNHSGASVMIEGFTDDRGGGAVNQRLSTERARFVQQALVERGIDSSRIEVAGRGSDQPVASNDTVEGRARNRRVELTFVADGTQRVAEAEAPR